MASVLDWFMQGTVQAVINANTASASTHFLQSARWKIQPAEICKFIGSFLIERMRSVPPVHSDYSQDSGYK